MVGPRGLFGLFGAELDFEALAVLQVCGVVPSAPGEGMPIGEEERPPVHRRLRDKTIDVCDRARVKREVVETGAATIMPIVCQVRGLFKHDVGGTQTVAAPVDPVLVDLVAKLGQEPSPRILGRVEVGYPDFDVMKLADGHLAEYAGPLRSSDPGPLGIDTPPSEPVRRVVRPIKGADTSASGHA